MIRKHVYISGRVQGVYFRVYTMETAGKLGVKGWVRNRRDGSVEAVFEGQEEDVAEMIKWCWQGSPGARVDKVDVYDEPYTGEFTDFKIMPTV